MWKIINDMVKLGFTAAKTAIDRIYTVDGAEKPFTDYNWHQQDNRAETYVT